MQAVVLNTASHCGAQLSLETSSCSRSSKNTSFLATQISFKRRSNLVRQTLRPPIRIHLPQSTQGLVVKAVATCNSKSSCGIAVNCRKYRKSIERNSTIPHFRWGKCVALHEIDGNVVRLKLQGACGSCPSSVTTMKMGIESRLMEKIPEIVAVEPISDEETVLELNRENADKVEFMWRVATIFDNYLLNPCYYSMSSTELYTCQSPNFRRNKTILDWGSWGIS